MCAFGPFLHGISADIGYLGRHERNRPYREQIEAIRTALLPAQQYLNRLCDRMEKPAIGPAGKIYQQAFKVKTELEGLLVELQYLGCESGVYPPPGIFYEGSERS